MAVARRSVALLGATEEAPPSPAARRGLSPPLCVDVLREATPLHPRLVEPCLGGRAPLSPAGAPRQSVYAFNGADPDAIDGFPTRHPGATVLELATNYRSSPQVVALAVAALPGRSAVAAPRSARPDGPAPRLQGFADDAVEAAAVAAFLRRAHRPGRPWTACAVLARTNSQLGVLEEALAAADPAYAAEYVAGLKRLDGQMNALHRQIAGTLAGLSGRSFLVFHPAFGYFADEFGLKQISIESEGKAPGPKQLAGLIAEAKRLQVKMVFVEPQFDQSRAKVIADSIGARVVTIDPLAEDYVANLESVARQIKAALE